jgi:hypothetical protein
MDAAEPYFIRREHDGDKTKDQQTESAAENKKGPGIGAIFHQESCTANVGCQDEKETAYFKEKGTTQGSGRSQEVQNGQTNREDRTARARDARAGSLASRIDG